MATDLGRAARRPLYGLFGELLSYPHPELANTARACEAELAEEYPEAAAQLSEFRQFVASVPPGQIEEVYTGTFDLDAALHPYLGYHLFGESYKRSVFLLELKERYQALGFNTGSELPDHLALVLRFLSGLEDEVQVEEMLREGVLPVLQRMLEGEPADAETEEHPEPPERPLNREAYGHVLQALWLTLQDLAPSTVDLVSEPTSV